VSSRTAALSFVALSAAMAGMVSLAAWLGGSEQIPTPADRLVVGAAFIIAAILGVSFALRPNWMRRPRAGHRQRRGHHTNCEHFAGHTVVLAGTPRCAGCTGLALGSTASASLMVAHLIVPWDIPAGAAPLLVPLGFVLVAANFLESGVPRTRASPHVLSNALLVLGFLLVVVGVFEATGSPGLGLLAVLLSFLLVDTRIRLSAWRHEEIRRSCTAACA
jgi:uncharacterized membrane protein